MSMKYKIIVKTLQGRILTYTVPYYKVIDGFVEFTDVKTGINKKFYIGNVEIIEAPSNDSN